MIWAVAYQSLGTFQKDLLWVIFKASSWCLNIWFWCREGLTGISRCSFHHFDMNSLLYTCDRIFNIFRLRSYVVGLSKQCSSYKIDLPIRFWVGFFSLAWVLCSTGLVVVLQWIWTNVCERSCCACLFFDLKSRNTCIQVQCRRL